MRRLPILVAALAAAAFAQAPDPAATIARYEALYRDTGNAALLWLIAESHAQQGDRAAAIAALERVAESRIGFTVSAESRLSRFAGDPEFDRVAARLAATAPAVRRGRTVATVTVPGLIPEGIAADPASGRLFLGDMNNRRIWAIGRDGRARQFGAPLIYRPLGMKVDAARRVLWVATTDAFWASQPPGARLMALDLATGAVNRTVGGPARSFNDLAVARDGTVYATDSLAGAVYRLAPGSETLERIAADSPMNYANGITLTDDGTALYVAQGLSLRRIELATGAVTALAQPSDLGLLAIDGLYWHRGRLIAVQNGGGPGRIIALDLSADGRSITGWQVLEAGDPGFDLPTTGTLAGDRFIFIANSQLRRLGNDGRLTEGPPLRPVRLIELVLPR